MCGQDVARISTAVSSEPAVGHESVEGGMHGRAGPFRRLHHRPAGEAFAAVRGSHQHLEPVEQRLNDRVVVTLDGKFLPYQW